MKQLYYILLLLVFSFSILNSEKLLAINNNLKIKHIVYLKTSKNIKLIITLDKEYDLIPSLIFKNNIFQIAMPETQVWPSIKKKMAFLNTKNIGKIFAYQYKKNVSRVRVIFPKGLAVKVLTARVQISNIGNKLIFNIPYSINLKNINLNSAMVNGSDEGYLNTLLKKQNRSPAIVKDYEIKKDHKNSSKYKNAKNLFSRDDKSNIKDNTSRDSLNMLSSSLSKDGEPKFSFTKSIIKFIAFFSLILVGFLGLVKFIKKSAFAKNKLGFLNSTNLVEVLSSTYLSPKKKVLLIKAHNQVFLVGDSENGLNLLSEIKDVSGLLKDGEKKISGSNFDSSVDIALSTDKLNLNNKIKKNIEESTPVNLNASKTEIFKEKLKSKMKGLKALQ